MAGRRFVKAGNVLYRKADDLPHSVAVFSPVRCPAAAQGSHAAQCLRAALSRHGR